VASVVVSFCFRRDWGGKKTRANRCAGGPL